ncbi:MAG: cobalamin biosynthesis protein CobW, partial [Paracoccaceae bacterium]
DHDDDHEEGDHDHHHDHDHDHDDFESFVVTCPEITDTKAFSAQLVEIIQQHNILRLKGFAAVAGKPMRLTVQAVGPRIDSYFDRPFGPSEPRQTRLVVIGQAGLSRDAIEKALQA